MQKKRVVFLEIISILTILVFVLGASFAYFNIIVEGNNTASMKSKSAKAEGGITFQNKTRELYFLVTEEEMSKSKVGTKYYATDDINKKYALESENHSYPLAEVRVDGGLSTYKCFYSFKISLGENTTMNPDGRDEVVLSFRGDSTITSGKTIDLYDLKSQGSISLNGYFYPILPSSDGVDNSQVVNMELYVKNANKEQGLTIANKYLNIKIEPQNIEGTNTVFSCVEVD